MNNMNNANRDFQDISNCNFNNHWSWSILFKNLSILEQVRKLKWQATVLEIGAANSHLIEYVKKNVKREDIRFIRVDVNTEYKDILKLDVTEGIPFEDIDLVIISEVIEHFPNVSHVNYVIKEIYECLAPNGKMVLTTPTPNKFLDDMVWPDDHKYELEHTEIFGKVNKYFEIEQTLPWSLKERDYNRFLETDNLAATTYIKLRGKMPESIIRAIISLFAPDNLSRQTLMICKKRRVPNA